MNLSRTWHRIVGVAACVLVLSPAVGDSEAQPGYTPEVGQPGKDVVWVPTPPELVERMLDLAGVTPQDFVMDLGSGDGRNVIAAARRGARALGVEYNQDMVDLSTRLAHEAGVADRARFVQGDMYQADISKADVLALFLLPSNLLQLRDKFLALQPGARIVSNTFEIQHWSPDERAEVTDCHQWCTALLYIVPAKVAGTWRLPDGTLTLTQDFQMLTGTLTNGTGEQHAVTGRLRGAEITLQSPQGDLKGRVDGDRIELSTVGGLRRDATRASD
jgi:precorrin-6B methylase 2